MNKRVLEGMRVAILASDMVEEAELIEPRQALEQAGADTQLIAPKGPEIISANHFEQSEKYAVDASLDEVEPTDFDGLFLPGGGLNADFMRVEPRVQKFIQNFDEANKPIAVICHAPWELIDAGVVEGRHLTSFHTIATDLKNAGAEWTDEPVVIDGYLVSSRSPDDIPAFNKAMIEVFEEAMSDSAL